jgi:hypothetical protein
MNNNKARYLLHGPVLPIQIPPQNGVILAGNAPDPADAAPQPAPLNSQPPVTQTVVPQPAQTGPNPQRPFPPLLPQPMPPPPPKLPPAKGANDALILRELQEIKELLQSEGRGKQAGDESPVELFVKPFVELNWDPAFVEDPAFRDFVWALAPGMRIPPEAELRDAVAGQTAQGQ